MKPDEEEKARQRAAELEKLKQSLFISNKSTDPRLVTAAVQPTVSLMAPVSPLQEHPEARGVGEEYPEQLIEPASVRPAAESPVPPIETSLAESIRKFRARADVIRSNVRGFG